MGLLDRRRLERIVARFPRVRLLVIGDVMLDEYLWGEVERISPEAPVPVVHVRGESTVLGGAGNVVRNILALGGSCDFCAVIGDDACGRRVVDLLKDLGVDPAGLVRVEGRPTSHKTRVVARSQQVVRFDREVEEGLPPAASRRLLRAIEAVLPSVQGAILEDYGKGVLAPALALRIMRRLRAAGIQVAVDPKDALAPFRGAALVKPNLREVEHLTGIRVRSPGDLGRAVARLRRAVGPGRIVVTRGADGMTVFEGDGPGIDVHTAAREVFDVQGAGDTTIAALALALLAGATLLEAAVIANAAVGVVVGKIGTAVVTPEELLERLPAAIGSARVGA
jgi:D-beta-D-heptose 7-phosphate kinase/D-beta-D-heptose 1-phosphate adenosyltransferase